MANSLELCTGGVGDCEAYRMGPVRADDVADSLALYRPSFS